MKQHTTCLRLIAWLFLFPFTSGQAAVIYDNGAPDLANAVRSDFDFPRQMADDFSLTAGSNTITDVHWFGVYSSVNTATEPDNFTLRIYEDNAGAPALNPTVLDLNVGDVGRVDTGDHIGGFDQYAYSVDISALTLNAGSTYWLSIINDTSADADDDWFWSTAPNIANGKFRDNDVDAWGNISTELAFSLTDDNLGGPASVPVPGALWLFAPALGLLARRRKHTA